MVNEVKNLMHRVDQTRNTKEAAKVLVEGLRVLYGQAYASRNDNVVNSLDKAVADDTEALAVAVVANTPHGRVAPLDEVEPTKWEKQAKTEEEKFAMQHQAELDQRKKYVDTTTSSGALGSHESLK